MGRHIRLTISTIIAIVTLGITVYLLGYYPFKEINLEKKIEKVQAGEYLDLAKINSVSWDSVHVLTPYQTIENINVKISKKYKNRLEDSAMHDNHSTLIFTKNNKLVNYAEVSRSKINFLNSDKRVYDRASAKFVVGMDK